MHSTDDDPTHRRTCAYRGCQRLFPPTRKWQRFCGPTCRKAYHSDRGPAATKTIAARAGDVIVITVEDTS